MKLREKTLRYVAKILGKNHGHRTRTAAEVGVCLRTIRNMIREMPRYGIAVPYPAERPSQRRYHPDMWPTMRVQILEALKKCRNNRRRAAKEVGIPYAVMLRMVSRLKREGEVIPRPNLKTPRKTKPITAATIRSAIPKKRAYPHCLRCKSPMPGEERLIQSMCAPCRHLYKKEEKMQPHSMDGRVSAEEAERLRAAFRAKRRAR